MRACLHLIGALCGAIIMATAGPAEARRVALVIGNADYKLGALENPVKDATAIAEAFEKRMGFDKVILQKNLTRSGFTAALGELSREASGADIAVVYFSGYGLEVDGENYLLPVDATLAAAADVEEQSIRLESVLRRLGEVRELKLVILDACRSTPFLVKGSKRGLARFEPKDKSTLVFFAAKDGTTSDDGFGQHSPFTEALLKHIATPNLEVNALLAEIGEDVAVVTSPKQLTQVYGNIGGKLVYLNKAQVMPRPAPQVERPAIAAAPLPPVTLPPPNPEAEDAAKALRMWELVKDSQSIDALEAFRREYGVRHPSLDMKAADRVKTLRDLAKAKLDTDRGLQKEIPSAPPKVYPPTVAPPVQAAPTRDQASLPPPTPSVPDIAQPPAPDLPQLARLLQSELKRVGCDPGPIDGQWGGKGIAALERFSRYTKLSLPTGEPTPAALDAVKGQYGRVCPLECGANAFERNGVCVTKAPPAPPPQVKAPPPQVKKYRPQPAQKAPSYGAPSGGGGAKTGTCYMKGGNPAATPIAVPC